VYRFVVALAFLGCGPASRHALPDAEAIDASEEPWPDALQPRCEKIDVLFVIDNSGSMIEEQTNLISNFPKFMDVLDESMLDYRIAVTTTGRNSQLQSGGDDGAMLQPAGCNMTKRWIDKGDPDPAATFSCVAAVGTVGPGIEMPLSAMRAAFELRMLDGTNSGFRRDDALLAIVIVSDEDDCSYEGNGSTGFGVCVDGMEAVASYVQFMDVYTGHRSRWAASVIAGPGPGMCTSTFGDAVEAKRLKKFTTYLHQNGSFSSICDANMSIGLTQAVNLFKQACHVIL
jgi:hypothetical protein